MDQQTMDCKMLQHKAWLYFHSGIIFLLYHRTVASRKYAHPPFSLNVIAKGHLLLESTPTQQYVAACMHSGEIYSVHVCVG